MGVADHPFDAGQGGEFVRGALGVAAGHQDAGPGILAVHAADGLADVVVGGGGDGAGVEDDQVGGGALGRGVQPLGGEQRFQSRAIRLRGPAAEIVDKICPHNSIIGVWDQAVVGFGDRSGLTAHLPGPWPPAVAVISR